jgi:hypothetical protein
MFETNGSSRSARSAPGRIRPRAIRAAIALVAVGGALAGGCVNWYYAHPGAIGAAMANTAPAARSELWQRAVLVLIDNGYVPQVLNEQAAYIMARRREDIADDAFARTIAIFTISSKGQARLGISGEGRFRSEAEFVAAAQERQEALLKLVLDNPGAPTRVP